MARYQNRRPLSDAEFAQILEDENSDEEFVNSNPEDIESDHVYEEDKTDDEIKLQVL